jgi:hypothetical protein
MRGPTTAATKIASRLPGEIDALGPTLPLPVSDDQNQEHGKDDEWEQRHSD